MVEYNGILAVFCEIFIEHYLPAASSYNSGNCFLKNRRKLSVCRRARRTPAARYRAIHRKAKAIRRDK
ncbi:hypothetical protein, partial [Treponema endosymbiont of Eucomonympha sp.]|uniref:hypothetical protein n=1 Tax=Treponema endosymbiont of Eucomonympha sp. TaxID=1580831 RepID=UPI001EE72E11